MINELIANLIEQRKQIEGEIDFSTNPIIQEMIRLLSNNVVDTIYFLDNDCTGEQFVYLSEIFDEIVENTQSQALVDALRRCAKKYPQETSEYNLNYFIDSAADYIL